MNGYQFCKTTTLSTDWLHWKNAVYSISDFFCDVKAKAVAINGCNAICHCDVCITEVVCRDIIMWGLELRDIHRNLISWLSQAKLT